MTRWTHDGLLADLASHLRGPDRMVWLDMQLGPSGSPRPDAFTLQKSYSRPLPTAYEVKISRSDFRSDTTSGKWQSYLKYAGSVTFCVPDGLVTLADIPDGCGLLVRKAEVWRYARRPTLQSVSIPRDAWMKLLIDGVGRVSASPMPRPRTAESWRQHEGIRKKFGDAVEQAARDLLAAQSRIADMCSVADAEYDRVRRDAEIRKVALIDEAKRQAAEYEAARRDLIEWLALPPDCSIFEVRHELTRARAACDADARVAAAEEKLRRARTSIEQASAAVAADKAPAFSLPAVQAVA